MKRAPNARVDQPVSPASPPNQTTETLADGRRVTIRPIRRDDVHRNAAFLSALSPPSKHFLFLGAISEFSDEQLRRLCDLDYAQEPRQVIFSLMLR
ncbi:MAG TPA: hypothetical protein VFJ95_10870 [Gammaproteobacteria bacterium]|nr:hypothetical protein [Gammaproteobacteria bacterium]